MRRRILVAVVLVFGALQLIRPEKNLAAVAPGSNDPLARFVPSPEVKRILEQACYDCHSNRTRYPWYAEIQPVGWWLAWHIHEAKGHLNFSEFGAYSRKQQTRKFNAISEEATDREMPLRSYAWLHAGARLTDAQIRALTDWSDAWYEKLAVDGEFANEKH